MITINKVDVSTFIKEFPNKELRIPLSDFINKDNKFVTVEWRFNDDSDFIKLLFISKELKKYSFHKTLNICYMPYSRMDRSEKEYVFTLKYICDFINSLEYDSVKVFDPHSDVTCALLNNSESIIHSHNLIENINNYIGSAIYFPDAGAYKKYSKLFQGYSYLIGLKTRNFSTGKIEDLKIIGDIAENEQVIMVDDICVYGNTFIKGAEALKALGAGDIHLCVSHCEKAILDGEIPKTDLITSVHTYNSILSQSIGKITVHNIEI